jgi:hypothetical protein
MLKHGFSQKVASSRDDTMKYGWKMDPHAFARWYESTDDKWVQPYFDSGDLRSMDRELFS